MLWAIAFIIIAQIHGATYTFPGLQLELLELLCKIYQFLINFTYA